MAKLAWMDVDSSVLAAIAYDRDAETIYVRFIASGAEWRYAGCRAADWAEFSDPSMSKGRYLNEVLKHRAGTRVR